MKICDITFLYFPRGGGIKTYIDTKRAEYKKMNIQHFIIAPETYASSAIRKETQGTLSLYYVPSIKLSVNGVTYYIFKHFKYLQEILLQEKPNIIEIGDKFTTLFFYSKILALKKILSAKIFVFSHERADNFMHVAYGLYRGHSFIKAVKSYFFISFENILMKKFTGAADEIICNSEFTAQEIRPYTTKPIHILSLGIEKEDFENNAYFDQTLRDKLSAFGEKKIIIHIGRLDKDKKIELLIDIAKKLDPKKYILVVVGGGSEEKEFKKILCVYLTGYIKREEVRKYLSIADLGILVNNIEPFGLVALEMMAISLPILGPNEGGLSGILKESFSWKLPYSLSSYLGALDEWEKRSDKKNMKRNAREEFLAHYTSTSMVENLLKIYKG